MRRPASSTPAPERFARRETLEDPEADLEALVS